MRNESEIKYEKVTASADQTKPFKKRLFRPKIELKNCKKCMACLVYCPTNCIELSKTGNPAINYNFCNGCLICLRECTHGAISEEKE